MSRIGKLPIKVPSDVKVVIDGQKVSVVGKLGSLEHVCNKEIIVKLEDGHVTVNPIDDSNIAMAMWGLNRSLIANMVKGVVEGYTVQLLIKGTGYRANVAGKYLNLFLGYSHEIKVFIPKGISIKVEKAPQDQTAIFISGYNKQDVGQLAAKIRKLRKPEPYKGKGVRYSDERILRKVGKTK